jgi:hypothetical protein
MRSGNFVPLKINFLFHFLVHFRIDKKQVFINFRSGCYLFFLF